MERELWPRLYQRVMEVSEKFRITDVTFQPHIIVLVLLWAALHDRPIRWACRPANWSTTTLRPATIPSQSTLSRRLRRLDTAMLVRHLFDDVREKSKPVPMVTVVDAKPLPVGGSTGDPQARCGRGAGAWAKGYKLFSLWGNPNRPVPESYRIYSMNINEGMVSMELTAEARGGGYLLGDGAYDAKAVYEAAGAAGYQLLAPREDPTARPWRNQSPYRLRCIELMASEFGRRLFRLRGRIERAFGSLTSFGGGLNPLPAWVRHLKRVWIWTSAKILINAERILRNQRLTA